MADDTPDAPAAETKPTPRRRGPNKVRPDGPAKPGRKPRAKSVVEAVAETAEKAEAVVVDAAKKPVASVTSAAKSVAKAVKPRAAKRTTPRPATKAKTADKGKRGWGSAVIAGGLAAAGAAATAAVFALRSSSAKPKPPAPKPPAPKAGAHQPDGADSSKSFDAGIADESSIPNEA